MNLLLRHFGTDPAFFASLVERAAELDLRRPLFYALRYTARVLGTPISENAFAGLGGGLALDGRYRPVVEFMYPDFMWVAAVQVFNQIGCAVCHTQSFTTQPSTVPGLSNRTFQPFSDFAVHHMGATLADGVTQGLAGPDQFRTAPLWGLGQRLFFLHDGRTSDLLRAIMDHFSFGSFQYPPSSANEVIENFTFLSTSDQQAILNFLRSL